MVDRYLSIKLGVIPLGGFRENNVYGRTDDGRTTDDGIQNFEKRKKGLEIWWTATFPQNLALICFTVSEKTHFTDDGRLTPAPRQ